MTNTHSNEQTPVRPLRLWPGVVAATLLLIVGFVVPLVVPGGAIIGILGGVAGALAVTVWWLFFSRAAWVDRIGGIVVMAVAVFGTSFVVHESVENGMQGAMLPIFSIPLMSVALVASVAASRRVSSGLRRVLIGTAVLLACGTMTLVRTGGVSGDGESDLHWRWTETPEERLLAQADELRDSAPAEPPASTSAPAPSEPTAPTPAPSPSEPEAGIHEGGGDKPASIPASADARTSAEWPGFRGPERDSVIRGVRIETDWSRTPPVELWRRPIGPGWSSFAVRGNLVYTQEQRGDDEIVSAYNLNSGEPVWRHRDAARFWESNGGAGPRGTPTISGGRVYALGATGILNALDADDGQVIWSRNAAADTSTTIPDWGLSSSPLVIDSVVIVGVAGQLAAYELATGKPRWFGPVHGGSYSSPHLMTLDGVAQILQPSGAGVTSVAPADGALLWEHQWTGGTILQPARTPDGDVLLSILGGAAGGAGTRRIAVAHSPSGWSANERWTSTGLKPFFNDFVVHRGHAFGFDGSILASIDLEDGRRKWKGGRYGHGQLVLLPEQDLLLVLSEEGELALVKANGDQYAEVARFPALEGKTWNHPVLVGDVLLVRNGEEMAAFRLSLAGR